MEGNEGIVTKALSIVTKAEIIDNSDHRVDYSLRLQFAQEESEDLGGYYSLATWRYEDESLVLVLIGRGLAAR